jgi:signal transduction histidine kinase
MGVIIEICFLLSDEFLFISLALSVSVSLLLIDLIHLSQMTNEQKHEFRVSDFNRSLSKRLSRGVQCLNRAAKKMNVRCIKENHRCLHISLDFTASMSLRQQRREALPLC